MLLMMRTEPNACRVRSPRNLGMFIISVIDIIVIDVIVTAYLFQYIYVSLCVVTSFRSHRVVESGPKTRTLTESEVCLLCEKLFSKD